MFSQSLARPARHAARCVAGRLAGFIQPPMLQRHIATIHNAKAQFVTIDSFGGLVSKGVTIYRAGEDEAFVLIDQEVGLAMKAALVRQIGISLTKNPEAIPLKFYHKSLHFAHEHLPYPRLIVDKGLTGPAPIDTSVATLWLWAPESCEITLDNTPDHYFTMASRESHGQLRKVLDELKDR